MFYRPSNARNILESWTRHLLRQITPQNRDTEILDELSLTEILDLTYMQGVPFSSSISAHALFPEYASLDRQGTTPTSMTIDFPLIIDNNGKCIFNIKLRFGKGSELKIGYKGRRKRVTPPDNVRMPNEFLNPVIQNTHFQIQESEGNRLQSLAGPFLEHEYPILGEINTEQGELSDKITTDCQSLTFGYLDDNGVLIVNRESEELRPIQSISIDRFPSLYLWSEFLPTNFQYKVAWKKISPTLVRFKLVLRNSSPPLDRNESQDPFLQSMILPHVELAFQGGRPDFPPLQYSDWKEEFTRSNEEDRSLIARERLYKVSQSGCIATQSPSDKGKIFLTTFGIFDTPREVPVGGPSIGRLISSKEVFLSHFPSENDSLRIFINTYWDIITGILKAVSTAFGFEQFYLFQWEGIQENIKLLSEDNSETVTVVRAPTGSGKTVVFMVNAAISSLCRSQKHTSLLMFPTRILNEDMFRRLTKFVCRLRIELPESSITGGILMGTSDPLSRLLTNPSPGEPLYHFGVCPSCGNNPLFGVLHQNRVVPNCTSCGHIIDYMFQPKEVFSFLPDICIATPDKIFYEATASSFEQFKIAFFGAPYKNCSHCRKISPVSHITLKGEDCSSLYKNDNCKGKFNSAQTSKPISYIGFDEVHSLYGSTATYLSIFLENLKFIQRILSHDRNLEIRYETATATISNEKELLEAITRRSETEGQIVLIPHGSMDDYFLLDEQTVRHRILLTYPNKISSREAFIRTILNSYRHLHINDDTLTSRLSEKTDRPFDWNFILGYLFKKQEGSDLRRGLRDMYRNTFGDDLKIEFLSGEAPKDKISRILHEAQGEEIDILLANLVISLGVDIHGLNHMVMLGVPRSFTEYVQTAGRTGRGASPGHVHIIMQPIFPRDNYLFRHFHAILSDISGYYDILPVKSTNLYCANEIFGNVAKSILTSLCFSPNAPKWANRNGLNSLLGANNRRAEQRVKRLITKILCNDASLTPDVNMMVNTRFSILSREINARDSFLSDTMKNSPTPWLINSLRGSFGQGVRITCVDEQLLNLLLHEEAEEN